MAVQISGNDITVPRDGTFSRNVSIAGTLTYEDVTNVDSIGLVTARNGIEVGASPGVAASISVDGNAIFSGITTIGSKEVGAGITLSPDGDGFYTGVVTATTFSGSGANLTSLPAAQITGTLPAISGANLTGIDAGIQTSVPKSVSGITTVLDLSKDDFKITAAGITTIDVRGGSEGNSHTLRIHNSGITTVGFSTYFLFPSGASPIIPTADGTISLISFTVDRQGAVGLATQLLAGSSVNFS